MVLEITVAIGSRGLTTTPAGFAVNNVYDGIKPRANNNNMETKLWQYIYCALGETKLELTQFPCPL